MHLFPGLWQKRVCVFFGECEQYQIRYQYGCSGSHGKGGKGSAALTKNNQCIGAEVSGVFVTHRRTTPSWPRAFHGVGEPDCIINVGVSGPGVVRSALAKMDPEADLVEVADTIKRPL